MLKLFNQKDREMFKVCVDCFIYDIQNCLLPFMHQFLISHLTFHISHLPPPHWTKPFLICSFAYRNGLKNQNHMRNTTIAAFCLLITISFLNTGCTKFRENRQYDSLFDHSAAESSYHDIFRLSMQVLGPGTGFIVDPCIIKTAINGGYTLTFGDSCTDLYNIKRAGSVSITATGNIYDQGTVTTATPSAYTVEGIKIEGSLVITTLGLNTDGKRQFSFVVTGATVNDDNGNISTWNCDRVYTQRDEKDPIIIFDDTYTVTGATNGIDREERFYETTVDADLVYEMVCRWPRAGKLKMSITDLKDRDVDYGNDFCEDNADCCDNIVTIEVGGKRERDVKLL
jgi:hypothetical protein